MNPYNNENWAVVIHGQDEIHAAPSFQAACAAVEGFNFQIRRKFSLAATEHHPIIWAAVYRWQDVSTSEHRCDEQSFIAEFGPNLLQQNKQLNYMAADIIEAHGIDAAIKSLAVSLMAIASSADTTITAERNGYVVSCGKVDK